MLACSMWLPALGSALAFLVLARNVSSWRTLVRNQQIQAPSSDADEPGVSVVVPLKGWDEKLPALVRALAEQRYRGPIEVLVVVDRDHPKRDVLASTGAMLVDPGTPPASLDKGWRLLQGVKVARHDYVMFLDSDVDVDPEFVRYRLATHLVADAPEMSFAIPLYRRAGSFATSLLAALTAYSNITVYLFILGWIPAETTIGVCVVVHRRDDFIERALETIAKRQVLVEDHALGRFYVSAGRRVGLSAEPVSVYKGEAASMGEVLSQAMRWMKSVPLAGKTASMKAQAILGVSSTLGVLTPISLVLGLVALARDGGGRAAQWLALAAVFATIEAVSIVAIEARFFRRRKSGVPLRHLFFVPFFLAIQPILFGASLFRRKHSWRGTSFDVANLHDRDLDPLDAQRERTQRGA